MNPFELSGPEFLALYAAVGACTFVLAVLVRRAYRLPGDPEPELPPLDPYEVNQLAGGPTLAVNAAIAHLVEGEAIKLDPSTFKLSRTGIEPSNLHPLEQQIFNATLSDTSLATVRGAAAQETANLRTRLEELGLEVSAERAIKARAWPFLMLVVVALFGGIKIEVGLARDKPVALLVCFCVATLVLALVFVLKPVRRSRRGDRVLNDLKERHAALQTTARSAPGALHGHDLTLALGLFGMGVLAAGPLAHLQRGLTPNARQLRNSRGHAGWILDVSRYSSVAEPTTFSLTDGH